MTEDGVLRWGKFTKPDIRNPLATGRIDALSFTTTPLLIYAGDKPLGRASGFYWRAGDAAYLITNWHVVTGNNPFTCKALSDAPPPTRIVGYDVEWTEAENKKGFYSPQRVERGIELFDDESRPVWLQHPRFDEYRVDVVAMLLPGWAVMRPQAKIVCVNEYGFQALPHFVGNDVFAVGYPLANFEGWMLPLWKRGTFSSNPHIPVGDRPLFLIDIASSKGMSGSPVFRRVFGPTVSPDLSTVNPLAVVTTEFVGVYAGRLGTVELERVSCGYAWCGSVVGEIVSSQCRGTTA